MADELVRLDPDGLERASRRMALRRRAAIGGLGVGLVGFVALGGMGAHVLSYVFGALFLISGTLLRDFAPLCPTCKREMTRGWTWAGLAKMCERCKTDYSAEAVEKAQEPRLPAAVVRKIKDTDQ